MVATVRLDENLETTLNRVAKILHKKKSEVIRDAISFYAENVEKDKKSRILTAVNKTKIIDKNEFKDFDGAINDGI